MFYTIYRITNLLDGKIYIGKHQTKNLDDGYMGSGKILRRAIKKHGIENFKKEILNVFNTEVEMNAKEAELVNEEFVDRDDTYNICFGGHGGFGYINQNILSSDDRRRNGLLGAPFGKENFTKKYYTDEKFAFEHREHLRKIQIPGSFGGKKHTEETKKKMSEAISVKSRGSCNSQFGTMWITNGEESRKIKKDLDNIPEGWHKGRKIVPS